MKDTAYLQAFEQKLANILLEAIGENATYDGQLLASQDIEDYWHSIAPEYMADAVPKWRNIQLCLSHGHVISVWRLRTVGTLIGI